MAHSGKIETNSSLSKERYVSCIKIHGIPILPPLMSDEKRKQMQYYKELAIETEYKLKLKKLKLNSFSSTDDATYVDDSDDSSSTSDSIPCSSADDQTGRSQTTFSESYRGDILHMLRDKSEVKHSGDVDLPLIDSTAIEKVPLLTSNKSDLEKCVLEQKSLPVVAKTTVTEDEKVLNLPKQAVLVTVVRQQSYTVSDIKKVFADDILKNLTNKNPPNTIIDSSIISIEESSFSDVSNNNNTSEINNTVIDLNTSNESPKLLSDTNEENENACSKISPPPLIRSNSYILDTPSPLLLAQIQQNKELSIAAAKDAENSVRKRRAWDFANARQKWSSIENDFGNQNGTVVPPEKKNAFNSLPSSATNSPDVKMFNSSCDNLMRQPPQKYNVKKSELPPSQKLKTFLKNSIPKTPPKPSSKIISSSKSISQEETRAEKELSPKSIKSSSKKTVTTPTNKKTEESLNKPNTPLRKTSLTKTPNAITLPKTPDILCIKSQDQIRDIIEKIQCEQSKQMAELIARQKSEQEKLMKAFAEQQTLLLSTIKDTYQLESSTKKSPATDAVITNQNTNLHDNSPHEAEILKNSESLLSECKKLLQNESFASENFGRPSSQISYQTTVTNSDDTLVNLTIRSELNERYTSSPLVDGSKICNLQPISSHHPKHMRSCSEDSIVLGTSAITPIPNNTIVPKDHRINTGCSRQLFPSKKQIWAASIICAAARGYLVRRLIKTERVQSLIQTIRDTLLCAMELHHETADNIQPADVELHRRLIQQVTAACYTFHDMFFCLPKAEQMSIISVDRERQKEKLLRPQSARSTSSLSSTTQRVLERKLRRASNESNSAAVSRSSSSRSCHSGSEFRARARSLGMSVDAVQCNKKASPENDVMRRAMSYGANKKPWR